jgi:hypothetical protein
MSKQSPKPLLRAALTKASLKDPIQLEKQWYGKAYAEYVDEQVEQLASRGDVQGLLLCLKAGLLNPSLASDIGERRCLSIVSFAKSSRADSREEMVEHWMRELLKFHPQQAAASFVGMVRRGEALPENSTVGWGNICAEVKGSLKAGLELGRNLPVRLRVRQPSHCPGITLENCTVLGLIFNSAPTRIISELLESEAMTVEAIRNATCGSLRQTHAVEHSVSEASIIDMALHMKGAHDKLDLCLREICTSTPTGKMELAKSIENFSRSLSPLEQSDVVKVSLAMSKEPDFSISSTDIPLSRWSKTAILHDLCVIDRISRGSSGISVPGLAPGLAEGAIKILLSLRSNSGQPIFNPNTRSSSGETVLHVAAAGESAKICLSLLSAGSDHEALTPDGLNARDIAAANGNEKIVALLSSVHANSKLDRLLAPTQSKGFRP